jgi:hypothetical protein
VRGVLGLEAGDFTNLLGLSISSDSNGDPSKRSYGNCSPDIASSLELPALQHVHRSELTTLSKLRLHTDFKIFHGSVE